MTADTILFHPSELGEIMTGVAKNWSVDESQTCKQRLVKIFREHTYGRRYNHSNKYTEKGLVMEESGITLYSLVTQKFFKKNSERLENKYFTGEPDIRYKNETIDIKLSWSLDTFPHKETGKPDKAYEYQGHGYMDLTGAERHIIAYCLVNAPANLITEEKRKLWYKMNCPNDNNPAYAKEKIEIEKRMIFDMPQFKADNPGYDVDCYDWEYDIPKEERVVEFIINRNETDLRKIYDRIDKSREWMNENLFQLQPTT